jgi:hypothetical protein
MIKNKKIKNKTSQKHTFILVSIFKLLQFGHYHLAVTILSKLPSYPQLLLIFSLTSPHFSFLFVFTYFYICFGFDDTKLKFIVIDMILICVSSLLIFFFFRYDGCFMVFKKEKGIMNEKESDQEGVIKVIRYGKCFISSKEFICTNTFAD